MVKIALTGGIGTGKTYLSRHFAEMGIPVFYADDEAKKLYSDPDFLKQMYLKFPNPELWNDKGDLNFQNLKNSFSNKDFLKELSCFVHPFVMKRFENWAEQQGTQSVIMESAIIFEYCLEKYFDKIIVANAPDELRIKRIKARNPELTYEQINDRISQQMSQTVKCSRADLVVCTGETYLESKSYL